MSQWNRIKVDARPQDDRVTLHLTRGDNHGVTERSQFTMPLRDFNAALSAAKVTIPWAQVSQ